MSKIVYLLIFLVSQNTAYCTINELEQHAELTTKNRNHIVKSAKSRKVHFSPMHEQNNASSISDYPELEPQILSRQIQCRKIKSSFEMMQSKYFIQRLRGAIYLRNQLLQTNPFPLDWSIADFSLNSNHGWIKNLAIEKLKEIMSNSYQPYQHKSLFSLWNTQDPTLQKNVTEQIIIFQNNPEITIIVDQNQFESSLRTLLFSCYFTIHHSDHHSELMKLTEKSHSILKSLIKRFNFTTAFFEEISDIDLLEEIKCENGDLCIANIYTHILYLYHYNNNISHSSFIQEDKKNHLLNGIQLLFESVHRLTHTSKNRFNDFYNLYFTFFENL